MIRTFHSIGQGAFYTEEFDEFRFVYDCGTDTDGKKRIEKYIKNHFKENDIINALFISHFHRDHINGLEYLLSNFEVEKVFIPQYEVYEHVLDFMYTDGNLNSFDTKLTINPVETIKSTSPQTKVILVKKHMFGDDPDEINIDALDDGDVINSGTLLHSCIPNWIFIPINYDNSNRSSIFKRFLKNHNIEFNFPEDFITAWNSKKTKREIKQAFDKLPKNQNENSMVVYSGPNSDEKYRQYMQLSLPFHFHFQHFMPLLSIDAGCIYFGDYETHDDAWTETDRILNKYYSLTGVIQIPHHGSSENYRDEINMKRFLYSVISYGTTNKHGHPGSFTTASITKNHGILLEVTENPYTRVHFFVE
ncbi:MBL fold metallo-hydrolase [Erwinia sp. S38]|uniref:MBL fold metallo-hydrolase n=1 Tax=Erwinia sp. S38 TaxID=2769338 RepID=UPI00190B8357|nr:MBL fold metallo-hydrolase [Erwinia sp. S38]MBK0004418.1 MBL fold metallo-hydrolase [Erwinia sp. S38]